MKIRIGNDFVFNWAIERGGLPEDLSSVLEKHLHLSVFGKRVELTEGVDYDITGNVIRIEVTPTIANIIGTYKAEFHYILPDNGLIDDDRKCAVDVDAFQIVAKTAQADDSTEFSMTSDMAIAFKGDKGDSAYQVWLEEGNIGTEEDYFAYLRQPAVDAGASISELEGEIQVSEGLRATAESSRESAESLRVEAELLRQSSTQEAISNAEEATENANTAATNADDAREAIQSDLGAKAFHGYASIEVAKTLKEVEDNASVKIENLVVNGDFRDGLNGWIIYSNPSASKRFEVVGSVLKLKTEGGATIYSSSNSTIIGDKYYERIDLNVKSGSFWISNPTTNITAETGRQIQSRITNKIVSDRGFRFAVSNGEVDVHSAIQINLTETFGAGNEPTKEEMDLLVSTLGIDYFEGEITIPVQKLMQWQLAMIRQNRNAIIALGGTII